MHHVDELIRTLKEKLNATQLPVDLIVVADHGMVKVESDSITLDSYADHSHFRLNGRISPEVKRARCN